MRQGEQREPIQGFKSQSPLACVNNDCHEWTSQNQQTTNMPNIYTERKIIYSFPFFSFECSHSSLDFVWDACMSRWYLRRHSNNNYTPWFFFVSFRAVRFAFFKNTHSQACVGGYQCGCCCDAALMLGMRHDNVMQAFSYIQKWMLWRMSCQQNDCRFLPKKEKIKKYSLLPTNWSFYCYGI